MLDELRIYDGAASFQEAKLLAFDSLFDVMTHVPMDTLGDALTPAFSLRNSSYSARVVGGKLMSTGVLGSAWASGVTYDNSANRILLPGATLPDGAFSFSVTRFILLCSDTGNRFGMYYFMTFFQSTLIQELFQ